MTDQIVISDLRAMAISGALPHERESAQPLRVDLVIEVDLHDAGQSDELGDTVHYGMVCESVVEPRSQHAFVALGSNLGDRVWYLCSAVRGLSRVVAESQVFETDPIGGPDRQGAFLNMAGEIETLLDPFALLRRCQRSESEAIRQRVVHWGPSTLDVDIVLYGDVEIRSDELVVPHPRFAERRFVPAPLADIAPDRCPACWDDALEPAGAYPRGPLASP